MDAEKATPKVLHNEGCHHKEEQHAASISNEPYHPVPVGQDRQFVSSAIRAVLSKKIPTHILILIKIIAPQLLF
jgi:hypothetical protein